MITRRTALGLPLALLATRAFAAGAPPLAIVMNSAAASVSVIDMTTRKVVDTLPTYREPSHWALTPDRRTLYVSDASGNALFGFDPITAAPLGHVRMADPYQLGYTPDQKYLVVNALRLDHVDVYDAQTLKLVKRFAPGSMPSHLDFSPDSRWSFNSMQGADTLVSFDLTNMTTRWKTHVGNTPAGVLWHNGKVLVAVMGASQVVELDPESGAITRRVKTGKGAHNIFRSPRPLGALRFQPARRLAQRARPDHAGSAPHLSPARLRPGRYGHRPGRQALDRPALRRGRGGDGPGHRPLRDDPGRPFAARHFPQHPIAPAR